MPLIGWFRPVPALSPAAASSKLATSLSFLWGHRLDAEEPVHVDRPESLLCWLPCDISGIALAMPPVPVVPATPLPSRRNHVSIVKRDRSSEFGSPNATCCCEPDEKSRAQSGAHAAGRALEKPVTQPPGG